MKRFTILGILAAGGLMCTPAPAAEITFAFVGTVTQINFDPSDPFGGAVQFGSPITGSFTFDSDSPDLIPGTQQGSFQMAGPPFGLSFTLAGDSFLIQDFLAINTFDSGIAQYGVLSFAGDLVFSLLLGDSTGTALNGDKLPVSPPSLAMFDTAGFSLTGSLEGNQIEIEGTVNSLFSAPEPCLSWLCLLALGGVSFSLPRTTQSPSTATSAQIPNRA